ncbi:hypothetical protein CK203_094761 [Vitis vinifera]|uniref:Uncharacterized protein n=1 Tax=Vitis vinifera TaxID=29760 RepID=A0A438EUJ7_VITVI|nr:hypothetical protein CK203_094761 [Vitis vinifera]
MFNMMSSNIATTNSVADNSRIRTHTISSSRDTLIVASTKYVHHHLHQDILSYLPALKPSSSKPKISTSGIGDLFTWSSFCHSSLGSLHYFLGIEVHRSAFWSTS